MFSEKSKKCTKKLGFHRTHIVHGVKEVVTIILYLIHNSTIFINKLIIIK